VNGLSQLKRLAPGLAVAFLLCLEPCRPLLAQNADAPGPVHLRVNLLGYRPGDPKIAIAFSAHPLARDFEVLNAADQTVVWRGPASPLPDAVWGRWHHHAELDFSPVRLEGRFVVRLGPTNSAAFEIGTQARDAVCGALLEFMRHQRCGDNPWLDAQCHQQDGRTAYGPRPAGAPIDARGGWHDAGDLLKYLMTSANATAQMLLAYRIAPAAFEDLVREDGRPGTNGVPDVLDEARWGLDWMLRLHPAPEELYHQVADDRDHWGWRLPADEKADYGWGPGGPRVVYAANGRPQGLGKYQSESTGLGNLAGRYAAAMAMACQTWRHNAEHGAFAQRCLQAGVEVYALGRKQEGFQQGNSYGAPYRYHESTWADDMEWGAAELYRATGESRYLEDARRYARLAGTESWMGRTEARHYDFYPFVNIGHFALHDLADEETGKMLIGYYRDGIERCVTAGRRTPYRIGVPFIWCSNNLTVALATQCLLYERMSRDPRYREFSAAQSDWLLGRNPWNSSMFTGFPPGAASPRNPHLMTTRLTGRMVRGGLVDGPVYEQVFRSLKGVSITQPDPLAMFQSELAVYHDDLHDYSTNEPTMDGTASAILLFALMAE